MEGRWILKKLGSTEFRERQMNKRRAARVIKGTTLTAQNTTILMYENIPT